MEPNVAQERIEPENTDFQENSSNYENPQKFEDITEKNSNNEKLITDEVNQTSIYPIIDVSDSQLYERVPFRTPVLKYSSNIAISEIIHAKCYLNKLLKEKEEVNAIDFEEIIDSQDSFELSLIGNNEISPNLQVNEKTSNSPLFQLQKCINERQVQEIRPNNYLNKFFESPSKMSESGQASVSDSHTTYFNSPMATENPLADNFPSTICQSSLESNKRKGTSNNLLVEAKKNSYGELFSKDFLRQILFNVKSSENSDNIAGISSSSHTVDPVMKSNVNIKNIPVQNINLNERNSKRNIKNSENFSKNLKRCSLDNVKQTQGDLCNSPDAYGAAFENPRKKFKISQDASNLNNSIKVISSEEYKDVQKNTKTRRLVNGPLNQHPIKKSNSSDSSSSSANVDTQSLNPPAINDDALETSSSEVKISEGASNLNNRIKVLSYEEYKEVQKKTKTRRSVRCPLNQHLTKPSNSTDSSSGSSNVN